MQIFEKVLGPEKLSSRGILLFRNPIADLSLLNLIFDYFMPLFNVDPRDSINIVVYVGSWNLFAGTKGSLTK